MTGAPQGADLLFLDANILFSAAYHPDAGVRRLWGLSNVRLATSSYAVEEARRNLDRPGQREDLDKLVASVLISDALADPTEHPEVGEAGLPTTDLPILRAAVAAGATHLLTGDRAHFGHLYGKSPAGMFVLRPADYLAPPP